MHLKAVEVFNLVMVAANERVNQQQFRQALDVLASHMAITVNRMGERGWVARGRQMQDRRAQLINLTPAGAALTQKAEKIASKIQAMGLGRFFKSRALVAHRVVAQSGAGARSRAALMSRNFVWAQQ